MLKKSKIIKAIPVFLVFSIIPVFAGNFHVTPGNVGDYALKTGLVFNTSGNIAIDSTGSTCTVAGFCSGATPASITFGPFNIKNGQDWEQLIVEITPSAGNVDINILSDSLLPVNTITGATSTTTIDLTQITQLANGTPFSIKLVFNGPAYNAVVSSVDVKYSGNTVFCFPAPYTISMGEMRIVYEADDASLATLEIYDNRGRHVKTLFESQYTGASSFRAENNTTWNGTDKAGRIVNTGLYTIVIRYVPVGSTGSPYTAKFKVLVIR